MLCTHQSIKQRRTGNTDTCISCKLPIIFDGTAWRWEQSIRADKANRMRRMFAVDQLTGAH